MISRGRWAPDPDVSYVTWRDITFLGREYPAGSIVPIKNVPNFDSLVMSGMFVPTGHKRDPFAGKPMIARPRVNLKILTVNTVAPLEV